MPVATGPPPVEAAAGPPRPATRKEQALTDTRKGLGRLIDTPYGQARINDKGLVMWAEWEVWSHAAEMVADGLWTAQPSTLRNRQRTQFYAAPASSTGSTESEGR